VDRVFHWAEHMVKGSEYIQMLRSKCFSYREQPAKNRQTSITGVIRTQYTRLRPDNLSPIRETEVLEIPGIRFPRKRPVVIK